MSDTHNVINCEHGVPIRAWTRGVTIEPEAQTQLLNVAQLPFVFRWIAAMPDVHWGIGATVGSVIPTKGAIIPAAVGVDIGCGMMAVQTTLNARDLPESLKKIREAIERAVPHGRTDHGRYRPWFSHHANAVTGESGLLDLLLCHHNLLKVSEKPLVDLG